VERGFSTAAKKVEHASLDRAYVAPPLGGGAPGSPSKSGMPGPTVAWGATATTQAGTMSGADTTAYPWGGAAPEDGSMSPSPASPEARATGVDRAFKTTCPRDPDKHQDQSAAWAVPYKRQDMYAFYNQTAEDVHPRSLDGGTVPKTKPKKEKFTMNASFCLTRHPMGGTEQYKELAVPAEPTIAAAASWLEQAEAELNEPGLTRMNADWPDFGEFAGTKKKVTEDGDDGEADDGDGDKKGKKKGQKGQEGEERTGAGD